VPKKTGIDKITQIEDYELFDYDREVQPILNVLLTKTVEQSLLEVEEETELEEIRKYKTEYRKRQVDLREAWEEDVKREIQRIKHKNKALKNARNKRDQQVKTMHKLQSLNMAKQFLSGCFKGTLSSLAESGYWRSTFNDQLNIAYKQFLTDKAISNTQESTAAESVINSFVADELASMAKTKEDIQAQHVLKAQAKRDTRMIESDNCRIVHFVFDTKQKVKETPFTKKFKLWLDGSLDQAEIEEHEKFDAYIERFVEDQLEEGEHNPVTFNDNDNQELILNDIETVGWSVANNPFQKLDTEKYYPGATVMDKEGNILAHFSPNSAESADFPNCRARANFRDNKIRVNDDRKVSLHLGDFKDAGIQILLTVRTFDLREAGDLPDNMFNEAWFRLQNETTSQTLDYTKIRKIALPEDYNEAGAADEEAEADEPKTRNELIYIAGRIYCEEDPKSGHRNWIYERYNELVTSDKHPELEQELANLYRRAIQEQQGYQEQIRAAHQRINEAAEERRQAAARDAAKKKSSKKGKGKDEERETPAPDDGRKSQMTHNSQNEEVEIQYDLNAPNEFAAALKKKIGRRFTFGPITFTDLD
jgi:hypothetical protein